MLLNDLRYRLRALFHRGVLERELDDEIRYHLECEAEKYRQRGVSASEAMRQARIAFGGIEVTKEASRDARGISVLEVIAQDLRYALRALRHNPGFTAGVIVTLGLGIGANAAMFGIVDRLLLRTPAYLTEPARVHRVYFAWQSRDQRRTEDYTYYTRYLDLRRSTTAFSDMAAYASRTLPVGTGPSSAEMQVAPVSASLFDFFDARPALGRFFTPQEDTVPVGAPVAVLGYGYWQTNYGRRSDVLGRQVRIGTTDYTIIGVAPPGFVGASNQGPPAVIVPITSYAGTSLPGGASRTYYTRYDFRWMSILARRKPGVTVAEASADLSRAFVGSWNNEASLEPSLTPAELARPAAIAGPIQVERGPAANPVARVALWVSGVAAIVLLIACANVANLMLARAVRRRREIALRLALGVSRGRLARQLLTESLLLALAGGAAGLFLGYWGGGVLRAMVLPDGGNGYSLADPRTLGFSLLLTVIVGCLTGLAPVFRSRRTDLVESLKAGAREGGGRRSRARTALLVLQGALSVALLVGAGLFVRSLYNVRAIPLGYDVAPVLYIRPEQRGVTLGDDAAAALRRRLVEATREIPGVESAALGLTVPFWYTWTTDLHVAGIDSVSRLGEFTLQGASPEYLATVGTRILRGRGITAEDRREAPRVLVVSASMARTLWPGQDPLGQCVRVDADTVPCSTVVGVTEDIRQNSITDDRGLNYYVPIAQYHPEAAALFVRVRGDAPKLAETLRHRLQPLMPGDGYVTVTPMRDIVEPGLASWRLGATMFLLFGGLALALAAIGLYSVIAYDVAQRTRELGVRLVLGARIADVVRLVARDGFRFAFIGVAIGGAVAFWAAPWLEPLLYAESPRDPLVFGLAGIALLGVAALACAVPALRATRVNPAVALRAE